MDDVISDPPNDVTVSANAEKQDVKVEANVNESADIEDATDTAEEADPEELAKDRMIEEILVYAVKGGLPKPPETKEMVEEEITERLNTLNVNIRSMRSICDSRGHFEQCRVRTTPVNLQNIRGRRLGLKSCAVIAFEPPPLNK